MDNKKQLNEAMDTWAAVGYESLMEKAKAAFIDLVAFANAVDPDPNSEYFVYGLVFSAIYADDTLSDPERRMAAQLMGAAEEDIPEPVPGYKEQTLEAISEIMHEAPDDIRSNIFTLSLALIAADGTVNEKERAYLEALV